MLSDEIEVVVEEVEDLADLYSDMYFSVGGK